MIYKNVIKYGITLLKSTEIAHFLKNILETSKRLNL